VYRWADGNSNTLPVQIWQGDPALAPGNTAIQRWGDSLHVRGAGINTQIILDSGTKLNANVNKDFAILYPTDGTMLNWASDFAIGTNAGNIAAAATGHSIQFEGNNDVVWQKTASVQLTRTVYDRSSVILAGPPRWITANLPASTYGAFSNRLC